MFAPGAGRFLLPVATVAAALAVLSAIDPPFGLPLGLSLVAALVVLSGFFAVFFRDPERAPGEGIVAAADGLVRAVGAEGARLRISVFMNVTNVHVNRFPVDGRVETVTVSGSGFRPAFREEARHNLRRSYRLSTSLGEVEVVQMTGLLARRLVSFVRPGDRAAKGARLGMIVLGSRVDVLLPADRVVPTVVAGTRVRAGVTTIARERP